jgi:2-polyprenyl-3-methyl-5-hydroxy-6-metoxy-1,4-benzoquinol methylase
MKKKETSKKEVLEEIANFYNVAEDFDYFNTKLASRIICPYCDNKDVLEIGCATGEMTEDLIKVSKSLIVIEPSETYCKAIHNKFGANITIYNCFINEVNEPIHADIMVLAGLLHHIKAPSEFLHSLKRFLDRDGSILATVPNMTSLHRRIGVKASLLRDIYGTTDRNIQFSQYGRYDKLSFEKLFEDNGFEVVESYGYMLKPFSSEQMMSLRLDWDIVNALFELGKEYEGLASQLFIRAKMK